MIGTLGRDSDCGELSRSLGLEQPAVMLALAAALALPHPVRDLERLLEHLESLAEWREREPEAARLVLVPGGTDTEPGTAARQDVERRGGLDPQRPGCGSGRRRPSGRGGRVS